MAALLEAFLGRGLFLLLLFPEFDEGVEGFDLMLQVLNDQLDHDGVIEVAQTGNTVGNQVVGISEVGECIEYALSVRSLESPICVFDHVDQLGELRDSSSDECGRIRLFDVLEQRFGFTEYDFLVVRVSTLADLLQNLPEIAEIFIAEFEGNLHVIKSNRNSMRRARENTVTASARRTRAGPRDPALAGSGSAADGRRADPGPDRDAPGLTDLSAAQ